MGKDICRLLLWVQKSLEGSLLTSNEMQKITYFMDNIVLNVLKIKNIFLEYLSGSGYNIFTKIIWVLS